MSRGKTRRQVHCSSWWFIARRNPGRGLLRPGRKAKGPADTPTTSVESYLTPVEARFSADGSRLYVVCEDADLVLSVNVRTQKVVARVQVGHKPKGVAVSPDGKKIYVSNEWSDTVSEIDATTFQVQRTLQNGWGPIGLTTDRSGKILYVANSISNDVSVIDLTTGVELKRLASWRSPHNVALSRDGRHVYVANMLGHLGPPNEPPVSELTVINTQKQIVTQRIAVPGVLELRHIAEAPKEQGGYFLVPFMRPKNLNPLIQVADGWILTHGMLVVQPAKSAGAETVTTQVLLDDIDSYYAGPNGVAFTPDGRRALVTSSEADVVTVIDTARLKQRLKQFPAAELANRLDSARTFVERRLTTGANPTDVQIAPNGQLAYVVNRLDDSVTVVDVVHAQIRGKIDLGGPKALSQLRRGERLFHSARYCFQGQFACITCHPDNHIDGVAWNLETPQLGRDRVANRTLRGVAETALISGMGITRISKRSAGRASPNFFFTPKDLTPWSWRI